MERDYNKILYVGHGKTGTSAFGTACQVLGFRLYENDIDLMKAWNKGEFDKLWKVADQYDVFEDYPWPYTYKEFDKKYPNSKFILGTRDSKEWIKSIIYQSIRGPTVERRRGVSEYYTHEYGYKYLVLHEKELIEMFEKHSDDVREYFKDRPDDFLEVCWRNGDGWKEICEFLDKPIPDLPFPMRKNAWPYPNYERLRRMAMNNPKKFFGW